MTLNELVAVEVMGAVTIDTLDNCPNGFYVRNHAAYYGNDAGRNRCCAFMPTTSIADAWEVVEKMKERGTKDQPVEFTLVTPYRPKNSDQTMPFWARFRINGIDGKAKGDDPARTVCLAALRAVGVSEERIAQATKEVAR